MNNSEILNNDPNVIKEEDDDEGSENEENKSIIEVDKKIWTQMEKDMAYLDELEDNMDKARYFNE